MLKQYKVLLSYVYLYPKCYELLKKHNFDVPFSSRGLYESIVYLSSDLIETNMHSDEYPCINNTRPRLTKRLKVLNRAFYKMLKLNDSSRR